MSSPVTYAAAAKILGCHLSNVGKLVAKGQLRSEQRRDGAFLRADVERLAKRRTAEREALAARTAAGPQPIDPRPDAEHEWLTPAQVAEMVGITSQAVAKRLRAGTMPGVRKGRRWWVRADQLELVERARLAARTRRP